MRLAKFLAHAGAASRRGAEALVAEGRVSVAGETVTDPARDVDESSGVALDGSKARALGVLTADNLNPQKARLLLALALTVASEPDEIKRIFATY